MLDLTRQTQDWPWFNRPETVELLSLLSAEGHAARCIGGCVRDSLLGHARTVTDIDVATTHKPEDVMVIAQSAGVKAVPTGLAHGTITVIYPDQTYEVTTLRQDVDTDGRHATIAFTDDFKLDAARRDFTVNAIAVDHEGQGYDYFGGIEDLKKQHLRFIGAPEQRLEEDRLRALRYFRFLAELGWQDMDAHAFAAISGVAGDMTRLSGERVWQELRKLLASPAPSHAMSRMISARILENWIGPADQMHVELSDLLKLDRCPADAILRLAWLYRDRQDTAESLTRKLHFSKVDRTRLLTLTGENLLDAAGGATPDLSSLLFDHGRDSARDILWLFAFLRNWTEKELQAWLAKCEAAEVPELPITAKDLLECGHRPGPQMGQTLRELEALWRRSGFAMTKSALLEAAGDGSS